MILEQTKSQIVNYDRVEKDISPVFQKTNIKRVIVSSRIHREKYEFGINGYDSFIKQIIKLSNDLPSKRCVVVTKVNHNLNNIHVELYPVTGAA